MVNISTYDGQARTVKQFRCIQTDLETGNFGPFGPNFGVGAVEKLYHIWRKGTTYVASLSGGRGGGGSNFPVLKRKLQFTGG